MKRLKDWRHHNMPIYEYVCENEGCKTKKKPLEFTRLMPLKDYLKMPICPRCQSSDYVKKIIATAVPKSQSWRTF